METKIQQGDFIFLIDTIEFSSPVIHISLMNEGDHHFVASGWERKSEILTTECSGIKIDRKTAFIVELQQLAQLYGAEIPETKIEDLKDSETIEINVPNCGKVVCIL